jgi:hypothetical protein
VVLYAAIAFLATGVWIPLFTHLRRHPDMLKETVAPDHFVGEVVRPAIGMAGYVIAVACGWLVQPLAGIAIFILIVAYYAATSTGTRARLLRAECTPTDGNAENPPASDQASATA